jgi:hypothetical protein
VLNESFINFFRQGITLGHGVRSFGANTTSVCHICNLVDHVVTICPRIKDLKPKCGKCGLPHRTKNCGLKCGYYNGMGHTTMLEGHNVTGCGVTEHPPGSGHWVSAFGADLLLKGLSN